MNAQTLTGVAAVAALLLCPPARAGKATGTLDIYWVDSEGGGSTLIVTPNDESVLIDTGNPGGRDPGRIHRVATQVAGLTRIDHLITTHMHVDHFGGAAELSALMPVRHVYDNGIPDSDPDGNKTDTRWPLIIRPYREMKVESRTVVKPGTEVPLAAVKRGPRLKLRCVGARQQFIPAPRRAAGGDACEGGRLKDKDTSDNANSTMWVLEFGGFRFFDGGDVTWNVEQQLVCPVNRVGTVDVFQVNHHGLDISNNPLLLRSLAPTVAVMNNGPRKGTAGDVVSSLRALPTLKALFQVHKNVREDAQNNTGDEYIANLEEKCQGQHLRLSVAPAGNRFTMTNPANGREWTFATRH
jgi:beta-lactamase superfamily II metal-dependent hydrolase